MPDDGTPTTRPEGEPRPEGGPGPEGSRTGSHPLGSRPPHRRRAGVLLQSRSPLGIGFAFTVGALMAIALAQTILLAQNVVVVILLALFVALGLSPVVAWLHGLGLPRVLA